MDARAGTGLEEGCHSRVAGRKRTSGVLCHVTSLPSPYGIGTLGEEAFAFIDFLVSAGQSCWQLLPLGITGFGDSPYQCLSDRAGNPYLIDLLQLVRDGLLPAGAPERFPFGSDPERVDYGLLWKHRRELLHLAWDRYLHGEHVLEPLAFETFCAREDAGWLHDYALFATLKEVMGGASWRSWPEPLKKREPGALASFERIHREKLSFEKFLQFLFFRQWRHLRAYASKAGICLIGDLPIYVADDSVEVWRDPHLFQLDEEGLPRQVAGCPPDYFSEEGQLWGNPLYRWETHAADGYRWWTERMRFQLRLYDKIRIDHFRGLESYWAVPYGDRTARRGRWLPGPADALFKAMEEALGPLPVIAEDLGFLSRKVRDFLWRTGYPGMKVLQFAFVPGAQSDYLPHRLTENAVLYTGTHDNDTLLGWFENAAPEEIDFARRYLGLNEEEGLPRGMMRGAATSICHTVIYQVQDLLDLGNEARMNQPGRTEGNWRWRMKPGALTPQRAASLWELTWMSGRLPEKSASRGSKAVL